MQCNHLSSLAIKVYGSFQSNTTTAMHLSGRLMCTGNSLFAHATCAFDTYTLNRANVSVLYHINMMPRTKLTKEKKGKKENSETSVVILVILVVSLSIVLHSSSSSRGLRKGGKRTTHIAFCDLFRQASEWFRDVW